MNRRTIAAVLLLMLALSRTADAQVSDPGIGLWLKRISLWLERVLDPALKKYDEMQIEVYNRVRWVEYPKHSTDAMRQLTASVRGIRRELQDLSCQFDLTVRTNTLKNMWLGNFKFCKPSWDAVWGHDVYGPGTARRALYDKTSVLSYNQISERFDSEHGSWDRIFNEQNLEIATWRYSPAEADRLGALNAAWLAKIELNNKRLDDQILLTRELRFSERRHHNRLDTQAATAFWHLAAGQTLTGDNQ